MAFKKKKKAEKKKQDSRFDEWPEHIRIGNRYILTKVDVVDIQEDKAIRYITTATDTNDSLHDDEFLFGKENIYHRRLGDPNDQPDNYMSIGGAENMKEATGFIKRHLKY